MQTNQPIDSVDIDYERHGNGQPIILLHGGMAPRQYWNPVIPQLEDYAAVVPQRSGFGTRRGDLDKTPAADVLDRETQYVRTLVNTIEGDPILFGHSFGGLTAIESATDADVEAVVTYEPAILPEEFRQEADLADRMESLIETGDRKEAVKRYIEMVLHPDGLDDLDAWLAEWPVWPECVELAEEVVRMNRAVEQYQLPDSLDVEAPVLVLSGTDGPDFLRKSTRAVHDVLPRSRFVEFDGISHSGPAEAPAAISMTISSFLNHQL